MIVNLSHRALLCVSGVDAKEFLHNQFSNDVANLSPHTAQINAYCTHQGRIIALFNVFLMGDHYYLDFPIDLLAKVQQRLAMFVLNSQVVINDVSQQFRRFGLIDEQIDHLAGTIITYSNNQQLLLLEAKKETTDFDLDHIDYWYFENIKNKRADVYLQTSEKFIPQMLNLDIDELGVNFLKGCYPGQEVVARLHYLGKAKRRLAVFKSAEKIKIGDELCIQTSQSLKPSGIVVLVAKISNFFYCLATIEISLIDQEVYIGSYKLEQFNDQ